MRIIDLALKDLSQIVRDRKSALFLALMPLLFTLFFGSIFGSAAGGDPRLIVGFVDQDQNGVLSAGLYDLLAASDAVRPALLEGDAATDAAQAVADADLAAVVIAPPGFSLQTLAGQASAPRITVVVDQSALAGQTAGNAIQAAVTRLLGSVETARLSAEAFESRQGFESDAVRQAYVDEALALAGEAWRRPPLGVTVEQAVSPAAGESWSSANVYTQSSPGMLVQFVVFGLNTSALVLVLERKSGALCRLLTTPISRVEVIAGHALAMFTVVLIQQALLVAIGQLLFGVDYARQPGAILLLMVTLALWVASLGLLIGAISKGEEQVIMWSLIAMFIFSAMGGAWFPLDVTGKAFSTIGHLMPTAWAMDGFQNIVLRGLGFGSVLAPAGILLAYTVVFFGLAVWRFKFE